MADLDEIRRRKLAELQAANQGQQRTQADEQADFQQKIAQLEGIAKQLFTKEALQRYGNIKAVDPEKAINVIVVLGQMIQSGRVHRVNDEMLKTLLSKLTPRKKEMNIRRV